MGRSTLHKEQVVLRGPLCSAFLEVLQRPTELEYLFLIARPSISYEGIIIVPDTGKFNKGRLFQLDLTLILSKYLKLRPLI